MKRLPKFLLSAAMVATMATSFSAVMAATPPDTLVVAWKLDEIISLDPAELFEFTASEIAGNTYERLITFDLKDVSKIRGEVAESWTVS
ncbi:MAG: ABC transporter substrate-binding protein, partial [Microvirga sp.]